MPLRFFKACFSDCNGQVMGLFCKVAPMSRYNANILARIGYVLLYLSDSACSAL